MNPFEFFIPQNITVGAGTLAKLPECAKKLGGSHAMLISGPTLRKMGVVDKAADYLKTPEWQWIFYRCRSQSVCHHSGKSDRSV